MKDTITAIATGMANAGISVVRMSGPDCFSIIDMIYKDKNGNSNLSEKLSHTVHYGYIYDGDILIDEVIVLLFRAPGSYTKEDVIEIDCHGGILVTQKVVETVIKYGARLAEPGEFTKRAFLNGRIDLSQAEAVMEVIGAGNDYALRNSLNQLSGSLYGRVKEIRDSIVHETAFLEAALDDPEHYSLDGYRDRITKVLEFSLGKIEELLSNSHNGKLLREGIKTVIIGKPNVGKSSLMNVLAGQDLSIVTEIAGTTRDSLEQQVHLGGIQLNIIDTAGIRDTEDLVEKIGVNRAWKHAENADLIIYIIDATIPLDENDREIIELIKGKKAIVLMNKTDLDIVLESSVIEKLTGCIVIQSSIKELIGVDELEDVIKQLVFQGSLQINNEIYLTNIRQIESIKQAGLYLKEVRRSVDDNVPEDFYTIDLMSAYESLGSVIGESMADDLVDTIFQKFCMGK